MSTKKAFPTLPKKENPIYQDGLRAYRQGFKDSELWPKKEPHKTTLPAKENILAHVKMQDTDFYLTHNQAGEIFILAQMYHAEHWYSVCKIYFPNLEGYTILGEWDDEGDYNNCHVPKGLAIPPSIALAYLSGYIAGIESDYLSNGIEKDRS